MADSVYKVIELIGTSTESWEKAAAAAVERAAQSLRELRVAEIVDASAASRTTVRIVPSTGLTTPLYAIRSQYTSPCAEWPTLCLASQ